MTDCALPCFMFTCVPSGNVKLIPDIGSAASAKPSAPSAVTGRNIEPVVSEDGSSRSYLALFWDSRICLFASPTLSPRACIHLVMPRWYTWISLRKEVRRTFESWLSRTRYFFHAHSYRSSAVILLKILIWRQRYNDKRTCTRLHRGYAYEKLLSERVYYGDQTHVYVGYLRAFKSGYFEGTKIRKITDIAKLLVASENFTKRARGEQKPLTYSTIITELEKVWAIIKREDTTLIDPYGYDVRINH